MKEGSVKLILPYFERFIELIPTINIVIFFDMIEILIANYIIFDICINLLKALVDKVHKVN